MRASRKACGDNFCGMTLLERLIVVGLMAGSLWLGPPAAWAAESRWTVTPYLWLPTLNAELKYSLPPSEGGDSIQSEIGPSDYLTNLHGVLMLAAELERERWSFSGDLIWLDLTADASTVHTVTGDGGTVSIPRQTDLGTTTDLSGLAVTLSAGRVLTQGSASSVVAFGGLRYFNLEADLDWELTTSITGPGFTFARQGTVASETNLYDAVVGARGKWRFGRGDHWYVPWYADVGTGSSDLTWQAMTGIGYVFERAGLLVVWRHLDYEADDDDLMREMRFDGPAVGFSWRF